MEAILAFLLGVSIVLIVLVIIKVVQFDTELNSIRADHVILENLYSGFVEELDKILNEGLDALADKVIELDEDVQEFKECFEEDIEEIYSDIDELKDSIELLEDNSHPPVSEGGSTELKAQIEKLKKAFKKAMRK
tara:strand:+ start:1631 stop:2035 length:405 start_codon:yes stop_codon:yes gene_type:complete